MHYEANFRREESTAAVTDGGSGRCLLLRAGTRMGAGFAPRASIPRICCPRGVPSMALKIVPSVTGLRFLEALRIP
jgi:hypothetical protein